MHLQSYSYWMFLWDIEWKVSFHLTYYWSPPAENVFLRWDLGLSSVQLYKTHHTPLYYLHCLLFSCIKQVGTNFTNCGHHQKILGTRKMAWNKFHTEDPHMLGNPLQNSVAAVTWHLGFVHPQYTAHPAALHYLQWFQYPTYEASCFKYNLYSCTEFVESWGFVVFLKMGMAWG